MAPSRHQELPQTKENYKFKNGVIANDNTTTMTTKSNLQVNENNGDGLIGTDGSAIKKSYTERLCQFYVKKPKLAFGMFSFMILLLS